MILEFIEKLSEYSEVLSDFLEARVAKLKSFKKIYNSLSKEDRERLIVDIIPKHFKRNNHGSYFSTNDYKKVLDWIVNGVDRVDVTMEPSGGGKHRIVMKFSSPIGMYNRLHVKSIRLMKELYDSSKIENHRDVSLSDISDILKKYKEGKDYIIVKKPAHYIVIEFAGADFSGHIKSIYPTLDTREVKSYGEIPKHILQKSSLPDPIKRNLVLNISD